MSEIKTNGGDGAANNEVVKQEESFAKKLGKLGRLDPVVSLSTLKEKGYLLVFCEGNRNIYRNQVVTLEKSVDASEKKFEQAGEICSAVDALNQGISLIMVDGTKVTKESKKLKKMALILDGQHRFLAAVEKGYNMDFRVIPTPDNILVYINTINSCSRVWGNRDLRHRISVETGEEDKLNTLVLNAQELLHGLSQRGGEYIYTGIRDGVRKADVLKGDLPKITADQKRCGDGIVDGLTFAFNNEQAFKNLGVLQLIFNVKQSIDVLDFGRHFKLACMTMSAAERKALIACVSNDNNQVDKGAFEDQLRDKIQRIKDMSDDERNQIEADHAEELQRIQIKLRKDFKGHPDINVVDYYKEIEEREKARTNKSKLEPKRRRLKRIEKRIPLLEARVTDATAKSLKLHQEEEAADSEDTRIKMKRMRRLQERRQEDNENEIKRLKAEKTKIEAELRKAES